MIILCIQEPEISLKRISASALSDLCKHSPELAQTVVDGGAIAYLAGESAKHFESHLGRCSAVTPLSPLPLSPFSPLPYLRVGVAAVSGWFWRVFGVWSFVYVRGGTRCQSRPSCPCQRKSGGATVGSVKVSVR
jgi:hypothetical protein